MPKISKECCDERKCRIIDACMRLYAQKNFKDISLKEISELAGCTRTTIYNYFENKEEIFLGILTCEYEEWVLDLKRLLDSPIRPTYDTFAEALGASLEKRQAMLKILATSLYDIEEHSSLAAITEFKGAYKEARETLSLCLREFFKEFDEKRISNFVDAFFSSLFGIYPFCFVTPKQHEGMKAVGLKYHRYTVSEFSCMTIRAML